MLSRFALCRGQGIKTCALKFQPTSTVTTSAVVSSSGNAPSTPPSNIPPEFPPPSSKRDHVNFPRHVFAERPPPVRFGFIPDSWFQNFYPKTGYTGFYMFLGSVGTYLYSKEIVVYDHGALHTYGFILVLWFIHTRFGDKIAEMHNKLMEKGLDEIDGAQEREKQYIRDTINSLEGQKDIKNAIVEITKARTEIVQMQLESVYRDRLMEAYKMIKNKLDCQAELENVEKRVQQKSIVDYVISNVMKSITPDLEKNALQTCINDLNSLAAKA